jgi:DUF971 family protein
VSAPAPSELRVEPGGRGLVADFGIRGRFDFTAEFLRVNSPSAEVQGHGPGQRKLVAGRRSVAITGVEPVGRYAVRLRFDDGHATGLYSWDVLLSLGERQETLWRDYLAAIAAKGLSRDA